MTWLLTTLKTPFLFAVKNNECVEAPFIIKKIILTLRTISKQI